MSVAEIILFVSSNSRHSVPCVEFLQTHRAAFGGVQLSVVRLDTAAQRRQALYGNDRIKIHAVPTLVVVYADGDLSAYQGQQKTIAWLAHAARLLQAQHAGAEAAEEDGGAAPAEERGAAPSLTDGGLYGPAAKPSSGAGRPPKRPKVKKRPKKGAQAGFTPRPLHEPEYGGAGPDDDGPDYAGDDSDELELVGGEHEAATSAAAATHAAAAVGGPLSNVHRAEGQNKMQTVRELAAQMEQAAPFR